MVNLRVVRLVIIGVSAILVVNLSRSIWDLWRRRDIVVERQNVLRRLEIEHQRLKDELTYSESPLFIEQEARNRLGLAREGEAVILLPKSQIPSTKSLPRRQAGQTNEEKEEVIPNWKKWWRLFF